MVALADSFLAGNRGSGTGGDRYQVTVHVDQDPLAPDGVMAATLEDGTGVSAGRDGSDGLCPAEPEREKVWKPSQGEGETQRARFVSARHPSSVVLGEWYESRCRGCWQLIVEADPTGCFTVVTTDAPDNPGTRLVLFPE